MDEGDLTTEQLKPESIRKSLKGKTEKQRKVEELIPVGEKERDLLINLIGQEAVDLIEGRGISIEYAAENDKIFRFAFEYKNRLLLITPINDMYQFPDDKQITVDFFFASDFSGAKSRLLSKAIGKKEGVDRYQRTGKTLGPETLSFLRFTKELVLSIREDCSIFLIPATKRRERLLRRFFEKSDQKNILIGEAESKIDDRKNVKATQS